MDDLELLRLYAQGQDQEAFTELVGRHINWVHSAARRQMRDSHLAEDVVQAVFLILARKAGAIRPGVLLSGWLFKTARFACADALKKEATRQYHERAAAMCADACEDPNQANWQEISPLLEEAVARLGRADREAVLLRFYQQKSLKEVGEALGISEEAAKKRVQRAVEKLKGMFNRRGVAVGSGVVLATALAAHTTQAAPAGLLSSAAAAAQGAAVSGQGLVIAKGAMQMMAWAKVKVAAVACAAMLLVGGMVAKLAVAQQAASSVAATAPATQVAATQGADAAMEWSVVPGPAVADETALIKQVRDGIAASASALRTLRVDVVYRNEQWDPAAGRWTYAGEGDKTIWVEGFPIQRARMDTRKEITPWIDGAAPFAETRGQQVYDGKTQQMLLTRSGGVGVETPARGEISEPKDSPVGYSSPLSRGSGLDYSLYGVLTRSGVERFKQVFDVPQIARYGLSVRKVRFNGVECVELKIGTNGWSYFLDPIRGYAILGGEQIARQGQASPLHRFVVQKLIEAAPGVYYPGKVAWQWNSRSRTYWEATAAVANGDEFKAANLFTIQWPAGTPAYDFRTQKVVYPAGKPEGR